VLAAPISGGPCLAQILGDVIAIRNRLCLCHRCPSVFISGSIAIRTRAAMI